MQTRNTFLLFDSGVVSARLCSSPCRLSYHQRIVDIVPPTFSALIPAEPIFIYKYEDESACKPTSDVDLHEAPTQHEQKENSAGMFW